MGLSNCSSCNKPYVKSGNLSLCVSCIRYETQQYESYYQQLMRESRSTPLHRLLPDLPIDRQRTINAISYRLGMNNVFHLPNLRAGSCYVCREKHSHTECREPICLTCLDKVFELMGAPSKNMVPKTPSSIVAHPSTVVGALHDAKKQLSKSQETIAELQEQLENYRYHFGDLPETKVRFSKSENNSRVGSQAPQFSNPLPQEQELSDDIMAIIDGTDNTPGFAPPPSPSLPPSNIPRQYGGFRR